MERTLIQTSDERYILINEDQAIWWDTITTRLVADSVVDRYLQDNPDLDISIEKVTYQ